jgi:predicted transcriptional regulator
MATRQVTLDVPDMLYERLRRMAEAAHRTVEDELLRVVTTAVLSVDELSPDLAEAISQLAVLDDAGLLGAARAAMPGDAAVELEQLHHKRQREGLTEAEEQSAATLTRLYERFMLVRAEATALLAERGHDLSEFLPRSADQRWITAR